MNADQKARDVLGQLGLHPDEEFVFSAELTAEDKKHSQLAHWIGDPFVDSPVRSYNDLTPTMMWAWIAQRLRLRGLKIVDAKKMNGPACTYCGEREPCMAANCPLRKDATV